MASQNQQESYNEDGRCSNTTLNPSDGFLLKNCLKINQSTDNEKCHKKEARKRRFTEMEDGDEERKTRRLDLNLRLTPLGLHQKDDPSSNQNSEISSTSSCRPLTLDSSSEEVDLSNTKFDGPSLILMGCSRCLIYVMVSELNPKCPNCRNSILIDIFRSSSGKKSRNC